MHARFARTTALVAAVVGFWSATSGLQAAALPDHTGKVGRAEFVLTPVATDTILSVFEVDTQLWLTEYDEQGRFGALARVESRKRIRAFTYRNVRIGGRRVNLTPLYGTATPQGAAPERILMNWQTVPPIKPGSPGWEGGLATVDPQQPLAASFVPAQRPGDPLYSPLLNDAFRAPLTLAGSQLWSLQGAALNDSSEAWSLRLPVAGKPDYTVVPLPSGGAFAYPGLSTDAGGNVWGVTFGPRANGVSRIAPDGGLQILGMRWSAWAGTIVEPSSFWVLMVSPASGPAFARMVGDGLLVDANAGLPDAVAQPPVQLSFGAIVPDGSALWALGELGNPATLSAIRFRTDGAWSWYTSPFTKQSYGVATAGLVADHTLYFGIYHWDNTQAALLSYDTSALIEAKPFSVSLQAGQSVAVNVKESHYSGTFVPRVLTSQLPGNPACPLNVTPRGIHEFLIAATASVPANCGVTFTDANGIGTAMVNVNLQPPA